MAKIDGRFPALKQEALKGRVVVQTRNGQMHISKWPRKRGRPRNSVTIEQNEKFRQANLLAKYTDWKSQWTAIRLTKKSGWYPRDVLMSNMFGRFVELLVIDGEEYYSVALRDDVSKDIDIVTGKQPHVILIRGDELWKALNNPATPSALVCDAADQDPRWEDLNNIGGGGVAYQSLGTHNSSERAWDIPWPDGVDVAMVKAYGRVSGGDTRPRWRVTTDNFATVLDASNNYKDVNGTGSNIAMTSQLIADTRTLAINAWWLKDPVNGGFSVQGFLCGVNTGGSLVNANPKGTSWNPANAYPNGIRLYTDDGGDNLGDLTVKIYGFEAPD